MLRSHPALHRAGRSASLCFVMLAVTSCGDPDVIVECFGALAITVPLTTIPAKTRIETTDEDGFVTSFDECTAIGQLTIDRQAGALRIRLFFGRTPPASVDVKVIDLGTCAGTSTTVVAARTGPITQPLGECSGASATVPVGASGPRGAIDRLAP